MARKKTVEQLAEDKEAQVEAEGPKKNDNDIETTVAKETETSNGNKRVDY